MVWGEVGSKIGKTTNIHSHYENALNTGLRSHGIICEKLATIEQK